MHHHRRRAARLHHPGVTINGGGGSSSFSDFTINAGVTATFDGLIIATAMRPARRAGTPQSTTPARRHRRAAAGGIYDAGALTLTNSVLQNDTATGGAGGHLPSLWQPGGAGGTAAGGIYVARPAASLWRQAIPSATIPPSAVPAAKAGEHIWLSLPASAAPAACSASTAARREPGTTGGGRYAARAARPVSRIVRAIYCGLPPGGGGGGAAFADVGGKARRRRRTLVVTNNSDDVNTIGSLRHELALAHSGDTITFAPSVTTIDLASSLAIAKNVTIEGPQPGATTPGVTIIGGGSGSNFSDFTIAAGVSATFDGLIIADGNATGATGAYCTGAACAGGTGGAAAGGIYDAGSLTLTNSVLQNDTATGGAGGIRRCYGGGGGGGNRGRRHLCRAYRHPQSRGERSFSNDSALGGTGGQGGEPRHICIIYGAGTGGAGGLSGVNGGLGRPARRLGRTAAPAARRSTRIVQQAL